MSAKTVVITGKGGVGKTSLSAAFVRILSEGFPQKRILAIDADPAMGLSTALGLEPSNTVDGIRKIITDSINEGNTKAAIEMLSEAKFRMLDALVEKDNISFIAIGRPEAAGCYCKVNAYLKEVITALSENFDFVVIDGEAGIEQVNRRVVENIGCLVLVSDGSKKGINVINTVKLVADGLVKYEKCGVIFNRVPDDFDFENVTLPAEVLAVIGNDELQTRADILGKTVFETACSSALLEGAKRAVEKLLE